MTRQEREVLQRVTGVLEGLMKRMEIGRIMNDCAIVSFGAIAELKRKYTEGEG